MPVTLHVRQVRQELYRASGSEGAGGSGRPSTALLGQLFHQVFAALVGSDPYENLQAALAHAEPDRAAMRQSLVHHAYGKLVGPRLSAHQAQLQEHASAVLDFWTAIREACAWLVDLVAAVPAPPNDPRPTRGTVPARPAWQAFITPEEPLCRELQQPGWTDTVRLTGVADAVVRVPGTDHWCLVELKLGRTSPEADLAQACLYHLMLTAEQEQRGPDSSSAAEAGTIALVSFTPQRREQLFAAGQLDQARRRVLDLIGRLAGVAPSGREPLRPPPAWPLRPDHRELGRRLVEVLREYGVEVKLAGEPVAGPAFLRYRLALGRGVKVRAVTSRAAEIRVRLQLDAAPLISVADGRVVVDLQRPDRQDVLFSSVRNQLFGPDPLLGCPQVLLGVDLDGRLQFADLSQPENAHLLVAGTTGSGKTEWLRSAIAALILTNTPQTLSLLLIDPKRNAFRFLSDSPCLWRPIVFPDEEDPAEVLARLADEMDRRYQCMGPADSLKEHVAKRRHPLPRIVCICDEYADLISRGRKRRQAVEQQVCRLGAKARAAGIHLILATQQPSRQVIKGALDANMPARLGLKMASPIESRMLLDAPGAERLLGNGDLLFKDIGEPRRIQGVYLPPSERAQLLTSKAGAWAAPPATPPDASQTGQPTEQDKGSTP